jgi:hypothetical protein
MTVITIGTACPTFGAVSDEPPDTDVCGLSLRLLAPRRNDLTLDLTGDPACVKTARDHTAAIMAVWRLDGRIPEATLIVSELVTNAVRHAGGTSLLRLIHHDRSVLCLVADGSDRPPVLLDTDFSAERGRGLQLVAAHCERWNWVRRRQRPGKWVWALISPPPSVSR